MAKKTGSSKKKTVKVEAIGQAHIHASFNNIIVSLTNGDGQVISWSSAGKMGSPKLLAILVFGPVYLAICKINE
jgi:ribosomal protein S11